MVLWGPACIFMREIWPSYYMGIIMHTWEIQSSYIVTLIFIPMNNYPRKCERLRACTAESRNVIFGARAICHDCIQSPILKSHKSRTTSGTRTRSYESKRTVTALLSAGRYMAYHFSWVDRTGYTIIHPSSTQPHTHTNTQPPPQPPPPSGPFGQSQLVMSTLVG